MEFDFPFLSATGTYMTDFRRSGCISLPPIVISVYRYIWVFLSCLDRRLSGFRQIAYMAYNIYNEMTI